ncbi:hypothetical protein [Methanococcoides methylutens]|nr:hypothetical protein [Methanococcoides methylutens]
MYEEEEEEEEEREFVILQFIPKNALFSFVSSRMRHSLIRSS